MESRRRVWDRRRSFHSTQATSLGSCIYFSGGIDGAELGAQIAADTVDRTDDRERKYRLRSGHIQWRWRRIRPSRTREKIGTY